MRPRMSGPIQLILMPGYSNKMRGGLGLSLACRIEHEYSYGCYFVLRTFPLRGRCIQITLYVNVEAVPVLVGLPNLCQGDASYSHRDVDKPFYGVFYTEV